MKPSHIVETHCMQANIITAEPQVTLVSEHQNDDDSYSSGGGSAQFTSYQMHTLHHGDPFLPSFLSTVCGVLRSDLHCGRR